MPASDLEQDADRGGYRLAGQRHELHFIALAVFVDVYDRADVLPPPALRRERSRSTQRNRAL